MAQEIPSLIKNRLEDFALLKEITENHLFILSRLGQKDSRALNIISLRFGFNCGLIHDVSEIKQILGLDMSYKEINQIINETICQLKTELEHKKMRKKDKLFAQTEDRKILENHSLEDIFSNLSIDVLGVLNRIGIHKMTDFLSIAKPELLSLINRDSYRNSYYGDTINTIYKTIIGKLTGIGFDLTRGSISLKDVGLSVRSFNALRHNEYSMLEEVAMASESDLMYIRNMGTKSIEEIKSKLQEHGLSLKQED